MPCRSYERTQQVIGRSEFVANTMMSLASGVRTGRLRFRFTSQSILESAPITANTTDRLAGASATSPTGAELGALSLDCPAFGCITDGAS